MNRLPRAVRLVALSASIAVSLMYADTGWAAAAGRAQRGGSSTAGSRSGTGGSNAGSRTGSGTGTRTPARSAQPAAPAPPADATTDNAAPAAAPDAAAPATPAPDAAAAPAPGNGAAAAPADAAPAPSIPANTPVNDQVQNFIHYARIHNYQMANIAGQAILNSGTDPREVTQMFEAAARERRLNLDEWLNRQQGIEQLRDVTARLRQLLGKGYLTRSTDVQFIRENIERLGGTARGQELAAEQLRNSGELAVALMLQYLTDPNQQRLHFNIRQALVSMGRTALAPLTAATEMRNNPDALITILTVLGQLKYPDAAPYLAKVAYDTNTPQAIRQIAAENLRDLGVNPQEANVAQLFYDLAQRFYYNQTSFRPDTRGGPTVSVWQWNGNMLTSRPVPAQVYDETMAMKAAEEAMRTGNLGGEPLSLWLAADFRKEIESPAAEGGAAANPSNEPSAHYYAVSAGTQAVNDVLARSLKDGNAKVAQRAIQALQSIVGPANLFAGGDANQQPLLAALGYRADRNVRLGAAMAIAEAMPRQPFPGQERVVPQLAEAMSQTGKPNVLVVAGSEDERNRLARELQQFNVASGTGAQNALAQSQTLPSVDAIVVARDVRASDIDQLMQMSNGDMRLAGAAKVILQTGRGGPWAQRAISDPTVSVSTANDAAGGLTQAVDQGRQRAGGGSMDAESTNQQALRAAPLLRDLAISRNEVLNVAAAEQPLLATLNDPRPEIVKAAGDILALIDSPRAQASLAAVGLDDKTPEEMKVSLLHSLATSAKTWGNRLDQGAVGAIQGLATSAQNLQVRSAAADALGALNLPNQQAKQLILQREPMMQQQQQQPAAPAAPAAQPQQQPAADAAAPAGASQRGARQR